jgi:flavin-binding protein dodecin
MPANRFVGHSKELSVTGALEDAVAQAAKAEGHVADAMVEFEVVGVRGRVGGIAGFRDVWVEISVGGRGDEASEPDEDEAGTVTTMAVGEEGGELASDAPELAGGYTTLAIGEEGGDGDKLETAS